MTAPLRLIKDTLHGKPIFRVAARCENVAQANYDDGKLYTFEEIDEAQRKSDMAFHATFREIYSNLPEKLDAMFPTCDLFRYWCLIKCGYMDRTALPCGTRENAEAVKGYITAITAKKGAIVTVEDNVVIVTRALSQAMGRAGDMDRETRLQSYRDVEDYARGLIAGSYSPEE